MGNVSMSRRFSRILLAAILALLPGSLGTPSVAPAQNAVSAAIPPGGCEALAAALQASSQTAASATAALNTANLDRAVSPCSDFFQFAAGGWVKNNPIPAAYSRWGSFNILQQQNENILRSILEDAAKDTKAKIDQVIG